MKTADPATPKPRLSVLVCTFGKEGIRRVAEAGYPIVDGVEYCISWQLPEGNPEIPEQLLRPDIRVEVSRSHGLSRNRNLSFGMARGELALISDDDVRYIPEYFENIFRAFKEYPEADIITFKYDSANFPKQFPSFSFNHRQSPKGYFATSFEIAFRPEILVHHHIAFNENFGIGARWPSGEEDIFLKEARRLGLNLRFVPYPVARHDGSTTSDREGSKSLFIETKGAAFRLMFPLSWPLRMITHLSHRPKGMSLSTFVKSWLRGAMKSGQTNRPKP